MFPSPGHQKLSGEGCINCLKHTGKPAPSLLIYAAISARELTPVALGRWSRAFPSRDPPPPPGKGESPFNGKVKPHPRSECKWWPGTKALLHTKRRGSSSALTVPLRSHFQQQPQHRYKHRRTAAGSPAWPWAGPGAPRAKGRFPRPPAPGFHRS